MESKVTREFTLEFETKTECLTELKANQEIINFMLNNRSRLFLATEKEILRRIARHYKNLISAIEFNDSFRESRLSSKEEKS